MFGRRNSLELWLSKSQTLALSCLIAACKLCFEEVMLETVGVERLAAASTMRSASSAANCCNVKSVSRDTNATRTLDGSRWRTNSRKSGPSASVAASPNNSCNHLRSLVGLRSPQLLLVDK